MISLLKSTCVAIDRPKCSSILSFFQPIILNPRMLWNSISFDDDLPVSYDIEKDGAKVAVLTFVKSAYRLGETILGIVDINFPGGRTKVLKVRLDFGSIHLWLSRVFLGRFVLTLDSSDSFT